MPVYLCVCVPLMVTQGAVVFPLGAEGVPQCKSCSDVTFRGSRGGSEPDISHPHSPGCRGPRFLAQGLQTSAERPQGKAPAWLCRRQDEGALPGAPDAPLLSLGSALLRCEARTAAATCGIASTRPFHSHHDSVRGARQGTEAGSFAGGRTARK